MFAIEKLKRAQNKIAILTVLKKNKKDNDAEGMFQNQKLKDQKIISRKIDD